jgi:hypothetical protein
VVFEGEFQAALKDIDKFTIYDNHEVDNSYNKYSISLQKDTYLNNFAISNKSSIGDDKNNPFNLTSSAAYSPV